MLIGCFLKIVKGSVNVRLWGFYPWTNELIDFFSFVQRSGHISYSTKEIYVIEKEEPKVVMVRMTNLGM